LPLALRGAAVVPTGNPTTGFTVSIPASVVAGDLCFLTVTSRDSVGAGSLGVTDNDTGGNTWTKFANSTDHKATVWWKRATAATASKTVTVAGAVGSSSGVLKCFEGGDSGATPYSNVVVETNASGNETHATFTASQADSMLCAAIFNYANDNAVTSLTSANLGAFTTTEKLSTGGSDCACAFGHLLDSGAASATGAITWAQTDGTTYSITWAIKPALVYSGTGILTAGPATLSASATFSVPTFTGTATLTTGKASLAASGTTTGPEVTATAALTAGAATLAGTASAVYHPVGVLTQQTYGLWSRRYESFAGKTLSPPTWTGVATLTAGAATLAGVAYPEYEHPVGRLTQHGYGLWGRRYGSFAAKGTGEFTATASLTAGAAVLAATATSADPVYTGTATLTASRATLSATGTTSDPTYTGTGTLTTPRPTLAALGSTSDPVYTGAGVLTAGAATLAGSALSAGAIYQGNAALTAPRATLAASATFVGTYTGAATLTAPRATIAATGTVTNPAAFVVTSPAAIPANHYAPVILTYTGTGTAWTAGTTFVPSGVAGWLHSLPTILSPTLATQQLVGPDILGVDPPGNTGTMTITCSDGSTATVPVLSVALGVSPEVAGIGGVTPLDLTGTSTVWVSSDAGEAQLFTVSGGTGSSITTTGRTSDTHATAGITAGTSAGTLTITDITTGATTTVDAELAFRPGDWPKVRRGRLGRTVTRSGIGRVVTRARR
jgi:hypothetical protein